MEVDNATQVAMDTDVATASKSRKVSVFGFLACYLHHCLLALLACTPNGQNIAGGFWKKITQYCVQ